MSLQVPSCLRLLQTRKQPQGEHWQDVLQGQQQVQHAPVEVAETGADQMGVCRNGRERQREPSGDDR